MKLAIVILELGNSDDNHGGVGVCVEWKMMEAGEGCWYLMCCRDQAGDSSGHINGELVMFLACPFRGEITICCCDCFMAAAVVMMKKKKKVQQTTLQRHFYKILRSNTCRVYFLMLHYTGQGYSEIKVTTSYTHGNITHGRTDRHNHSALLYNL